MGSKYKKGETRLSSSLLGKFFGIVFYRAVRSTLPKSLSLRLKIEYVPDRVVGLVNVKVKVIL